MDYKDRLSDQEEIKKFTDDIFKNKTCGVSGSHMNFKQYEAINNSVSSEMFYSLMCVLHEKLPCAKNFYRLRKQFREQQTGDEYCSPVRHIASPHMIRGLSPTNKL